MPKKLSKRLFCGIRIHPEEKIRLDLAHLRAELRESGVKWVAEENIHLTLWFFGSTEADKIPSLVRAIGQAALEAKEFRIEIKGAGTFGKKNSPSVIWIGADDREGKLIQLYNILRTQLENTGYQADPKGFHPHVTIGRAKTTTMSDQIYEAIGIRTDYSYQWIIVNELILFESITYKEGPVYIPLHSFTFGKQSLNPNLSFL